MAFAKKRKKDPVLPKAERERIKKMLESEATRFKRPIKMQFTYKTPSGQQLLETARFRSVEDGAAYARSQEQTMKKLNNKWKLVAAKQVNLQEESQLSV